MSSLLAVAFGGMLGCLLRFALSEYARAQFPARVWIATLAVNLVGSLLIGWLYGFFLLRPQWASAALQSALMAGFLGGLTTFSSFSLDTLRLLQGGAVFSAFAYLAASLSGGLLACWAGFYLARY